MAHYHYDAMQCRACGFTADEAEFDVTDEISVRVCPTCRSAECYAVSKRTLASSKDSRGVTAAPEGYHRHLEEQS